MLEPAGLDLFLVEEVDARDFSLARSYSAERLASKAARETFLLPDL